MTMGNEWLVVLPLLVNFNIVTLQPIANEARQYNPSDCCPCPDESARSGARSHLMSPGSASQPCSCSPGTDDAEASASMLLPALRAMQPFVTQSDQKTDPKPLLQPEVGLASSVLETLRQATDEEYQEALARDAARSAVKLLESTLDPLVDETPKNKVTIFLNRKDDDMDDNLPEPSHLQETRCIHSPLQSIHKHGQLRVSRPTPVIEVFELSPKPPKKFNNKNVLHRKFKDMDNGVSASNIKEQVIQPKSDGNLERQQLISNPGLFDLFTSNTFDESESQQLFEKNRSGKSDKNQEIISKLPLKLRELIDNIEMRKSKVPMIDLKKYKPQATQTPQLQLSPLEKTIHNKRPLPLKDLLKLKDVELIPKNSFAKSSNAKTPTLKLQSESPTLNSNICNEDNRNVALINDDTEFTSFPLSSEMTDPETSPTFSNPVFESKNVINSNIKQILKPDENSAKSISSVPLDFEDQDSFDYGEANLEEHFNERPMLLDNCNDIASNSFVQQAPNGDNREKTFTNNNLKTGKAPKLESNNDDVSHGESNNETFQIEFLEDFDTPIEFDNSSFIPKSFLKNNDNLHEIKDIINDPIADTSNDVLQINNHDNGKADISQEKIDKLVDECNSLESFSKNSSPVMKHESSVNENSMQQVSSEAVNNEVLPDINEDPSQVSFKDLQDMSNSILSLSECEQARDESINIKTNSDEASHQINDDLDISNTESPTQIFEIISKEMETNDVSNIKSDFNANNKMIEGSETNLNEKLCKSTTFDDSISETNQADIKKRLNPDATSNEMRAEASEPKPKSYDYIDTSYRDVVENDKHSNIFTKTKAGANDILNIDKHSTFLSNIKTKLEGLFSTTEKVTELLNNSEDNTNESSNIKSKLAKTDKLQRMPQTLRQISLPELPRMPLDSFGKKLALPNFVNSPLASNSLKSFNLPNAFEEALDPNSAFTALSDKLRSHTENTIQNVKETLESTLKDSQNIRFSNPTDTFDFHTDDILESISNRRNEMKEKLDAIHLDLNDRFSSFQQNILDHFNVPDQHPVFKGRSSNGGLKASHKPLRLELPLPQESKLRNVNHEHKLLPHKVNALKSGKHTEINIIPSKIPTKSDTSRILNTERRVQNAGLHTTTTPIPTFIPRPNVLKTNIGSAPRLTDDTLLKVRPTKKPLPAEKVIKIKPYTLKSESTGLSEDPFGSSKSFSRINSPIKSFKTNLEKINLANLDNNSSVNDFRKTLLQNKLNQKSKLQLAKKTKDNEKINALDNKSLSSRMQESILSRTKQGRGRIGSRNNEEMIVSPTSHLDTTHPSQQESSLHLIEPMKENVPYKCKLMCYRDS